MCGLWGTRGGIWKERCISRKAMWKWSQGGNRGKETWDRETNHPGVVTKAFNGAETMGKKGGNSSKAGGRLNMDREVILKVFSPVFSSIAHDLCVRPSQYTAVGKNRNYKFGSGSIWKVWANTVKRWHHSNSKPLALKIIVIVLERWGEKMKLTGEST